MLPGRRRVRQVQRIVDDVNPSVGQRCGSRFPSGPESVVCQMRHEYVGVDVSVDPSEKTCVASAAHRMARGHHAYVRTLRQTPGEKRRECVAVTVYVHDPLAGRYLLQHRGEDQSRGRIEQSAQRGMAQPHSGTAEPVVHRLGVARQSRHLPSLAEEMTAQVQRILPRTAPVVG